MKTKAWLLRLMARGQRQHDNPFYIFFNWKHCFMRRRNFVIKSSALTLAATMLGGVTNSMAQTVQASPINVLETIQALRIPSGPYTGAYEIAPNGLINWYFANLGLISVVQFMDAPALDKYIRVYLDLYLSKLEPDWSIKDVHFTAGRANTSSFTLAMADSDDSYAATLLSLAVRYLRASQNWAWWDNNKARLKDMAYRNIAMSAKNNGLVSVFQSPRNQTNNAGYLMDNAERATLPPCSGNAAMRTRPTATGLPPASLPAWARCSAAAPAPSGWPTFRRRPKPRSTPAQPARYFLRFLA